MIVEADLEFIKLWNKSFCESLDWKSKDSLITQANFILKKYKIIAPWHPIAFRNDLKNILENKSYKFLNEYNDLYANICIPEKYIQPRLRPKFLNENLLLHFIKIENKNIDQIFSKYKSNVRRKIRYGIKRYKFIKIKNKDEFAQNKTKINNLLIKQNLSFNSPSPPINLIENLFLNNALVIYLAKFENNIVGFMSMSNDNNISQISWIAIEKENRNLSISFWHYCLMESVNRKSKIFSLGTTSSKSLAKFKEQLNAEKAILFKRKISYRKESYKMKYKKSNRNKFTLLVMNVFIKLIYCLFGIKGYQYISNEIWKRFD